MDVLDEMQQQQKELNDVIFSDLSTRILFLKQIFTCLIYTWLECNGAS